MFLGLFLVFVFAVNSFSSPLIFKATKEITTNEVIELASFDASKYKQIRIGLKAINRIRLESKDGALEELNSAKRNLTSTEELLKAGVRSRANFDEAQNRLIEAQKAYDSSVDKIETAGVYALEESNEILLFGFNEILNHSIIIDNPPSKVSIKGYGKGTYKIYVWGIQ